MDTVALSEQATLDRFNRTQDRVARDMGYGDTAGAIGITTDCLSPLKDYIEGRIKALPNLPQKSEEHRLLHVVGKLSPEVIALSTLNAALHSIMSGDEWADTVVTAGHSIKAEAWAAGLLMHDAELYDRIKDTVKRRHGNLKYRQQAARSIAYRAGYKTQAWSKKLVLAAGTILLRYLLNALPDVFVKEQENVGEDTRQWLTITPGALEKGEAAVEQALRRSPVFAPMTEPPKPWTSFWDGGHWDERSRFKASVVRTNYKQTAGAIRAAMSSGAMDEHIKAVNTLQAVPWKINERVLGVLKWAYQNDIRIKGNKPGTYAFPPANDEMAPPKTGEWVTMTDDQKKLWRHQASLVKQRNRSYVGQRILMEHDMVTADLMLEAGRFWCPVNCDWRGRVYAIPHFNFARDDRVRALFLFADGEPIGEEGLKWLKVHVANCGDFDKVSKKSIEERIKWTEENAARIADMCEIPTKELWWKEADKPFLFLAACFELTTALSVGPSYTTNLPVSFDGSCSGLQHLSAMTRDETTASLVNLTPNSQPQDVYETVAACVRERLAQDVQISSTASLASMWMNYGVSRKVVKRNVMTYAYSSKKFGMTQQLVEDLMRPLAFDVLAGKVPEHPFGDDEGKAAAKYLASIIYDTIERLVEKPAQAMKMLQKSARALAHEGKPLNWTTPLGLPWVNRYHRPRIEKLDLWLHDVRVQMKFADGHHEAEIWKDRAANGVSPNFVHACDAAHLLMVANAAAAEGIQMATVHDSFGCLASRAGRYRKIIREQFVRLYEQNDVLLQVLQSASHDLTVHNQQRLPDVPAVGSLNLEEVLNADYAFA